MKEVRVNFGFIKCCERNRDVAFHISEVEEGAELRVGDDVEFAARRDPDSGKLQASRYIMRASNPALNLAPVKSVVLMRPQAINADLCACQGGESGARHCRL